MMTQSKQYVKFMKQLEVIDLYHNYYHLDFDQIAMIVDSRSNIIECYCLYLMKKKHIKKYLEEQKRVLQ